MFFYHFSVFFLRLVKKMLTLQQHKKQNAMKEITNKNKTLTLCVDTLHAEPIALLNEKGKNLLWQGDPAYWNRHDPILFPTIGNCCDKQIRVKGLPYPMPKHGFAHQGPWTVVEQTQSEEGEGRLLLEFRDSPETRKHYPFTFCVQQEFVVQNDNTLRVTWHVMSHERLPFMIGAHPAFVLPEFNSEDEIHGYLRLNTPEIVSHVVLPDGFLHEETETTVLQACDTEGQKDSSHYLLPLTNTTFLGDTLLDTRGLNTEVTLLDKEKRPLITLRHHMPVLALWAPKNGCCPFVCIEPWCGCCDAPNYQNEFCQRPFVQHTTPDREWTQSYTIEVIDMGR